MSQLDLGLAANVSSRHISFLETGRAKPSRTMVIHLSETLEVPRPDRNTLLNAAGFSPAYRQRMLAETDMTPIRQAIAWTLARHDPYPGIALDRHWTMVKANKTAKLLFGQIGFQEGDSFLEAMTGSDVFASVVENWDEVVRLMIIRLRTESAHLGGDSVLDEAICLLCKKAGAGHIEHAGILPAVIPVRYRAGNMSLALISTIAQFGTTEDIAVADLKIELMFPADDATSELLQGLGQSDGTSLLKSDG